MVAVKSFGSMKQCFWSILKNTKHLETRNMSESFKVKSSVQWASHDEFIVSFKEVSIGLIPEAHIAALNHINRSYISAQQMAPATDGCYCKFTQTHGAWCGFGWACLCLCTEEKSGQECCRGSGLKHRTLSWHMERHFKSVYIQHKENRTVLLDRGKQWLYLVLIVVEVMLTFWISLLSYYSYLSVKVVLHLPQWQRQSDCYPKA